MIKQLATKRSQRAFTLMELLIVIAILGILGVAFVPNILKAPAKARDAVRVKKVQDMHTAIEAYYAEKGKLPDAAGEPCLTNAIAVQVGMQSEPLDSNSKGSCNGGNGAMANSKLYFYKRYNNNTQYAVGALMEVPTSANSEVTPEEIGNEVPALQQNPGAGTYFLAIGPI